MNVNCKWIKAVNIQMLRPLEGKVGKTLEDTGVSSEDAGLSAASVAREIQPAMESKETVHQEPSY